MTTASASEKVRDFVNRQAQAAAEQELTDTERCGVISTLADTTIKGLGYGIGFMSAIVLASLGG